MKNAVTLLAGFLFSALALVSAQTEEAFPAPDFSAAPKQPFEKAFDSFEFRQFKNGDATLPYRIHRPEKIEAGKTYPLVLLMHGMGERGTDDRHQLAGFYGEKFWEKYPCFVIAPQCPESAPPGQNVWVVGDYRQPEHRMAATATGPLATALELLKATIANQPVDQRRIYLTGLSMGGFATWELLQRQPDIFAAAVPVCGGGDVTLAARLAKIPLWVFHGDADNIVPVSRSRSMVKAISDAGGNPKYTEYPGVNHNAWGPTYRDPAVWDWLFAQAKK
jgi:predicted peptidase